MKRAIAAMAVVVSIGVAAASWFILFGMYDVGADTPHWNITRKLIEVVRDRSIAARARNVAVPDLRDEQLVLKGAGQYAAMCANCHLAPEQQDSEIRPGLYPRPPNLTEQRFDPKIMFWVTKHGLKMSGMPAWGVGHDDATIWSIVAFVNKLPGLSAEHYKDMVARSPPDEEMAAMNKGGGKSTEQGMKPEPGMMGQAGEHKH
jgi:mono/diheme cytochrome c family protein